MELSKLFPSTEEGKDRLFASAYDNTVETLAKEAGVTTKTARYWFGCVPSYCLIELKMCKLIRESGLDCMSDEEIKNLLETDTIAEVRARAQGLLQAADSLLNHVHLDGNCAVVKLFRRSKSSLQRLAC